MKTYALRHISDEQWWTGLGKYFGFPDCCIDHFIRNFNNITIIQKNHDVGNRSGFVPCDTHAQMIREGKIKLDSLITNRVCPLPFPYGGDELDHGI